HCPWMAMNALDSLALELKEHNNEISVDDALIEQAMLPLNRMLAFSEQLKRMKQGAA
ncbi:MAG TPA: quinolinate synthase, partial [Gammaproteobacteria bacterium]|nr:quinolinate synthase [Gammaproteobacteria bacterium]